MFTRSRSKASTYPCPAFPLQCSLVFDSLKALNNHLSSANNDCRQLSRSPAGPSLSISLPFTPTKKRKLAHVSSPSSPLCVNMETNTQNSVKSDFQSVDLVNSDDLSSIGSINNNNSVHYCDDSSNNSFTIDNVSTCPLIPGSTDATSTVVSSVHDDTIPQHGSLLGGRDSTHRTFSHHDLPPNCPHYVSLMYLLEQCGATFGAFDKSCSGYSAQSKLVFK